MDPAEVPVDGQAAGNVTGRGRRWRLRAWACAAAAVIVAAAAVGVIAARQHQPAVPAAHRPSGIPASIPDQTINLMGLSPVPASAAPEFKLTDQDGRTLPLSGFRGKVVVLEFMDPHCTDICPLVSQEFLDAYHDLGRAAGDVVFAAVNVNRYHDRVHDVLAYSRQHQLITIPAWHFFTGPARALQAVWRAYDVDVEAPSPDADIVHTSVIYFISPGGAERYIAAPMADHTSGGASYLPAGQLTAWGRGIAQVALTLTS
jgi:cytochrome oxidase Cu insertion factor (SCO1/SenC/PrrC family)